MKEQKSTCPSGRTMHRDWTIVVAASLNGVIGRGDALPWHLRSDLQRFKRLTMGHTLLMGRKTYQSIGRPLPGRQTIVLSKTWAGLVADYSRSTHRRLTLRVESHASPDISPETELETEPETSREIISQDHDSESRATIPTETRPAHFSVATNLEEVAGLIEPGRRLMVVGGAEVYRSTLDYCSTIWLTRVLADIEGDTLLPHIDWSQWRLESVEAVDSGPHDDWPTEFQIWTRVEPRP
jgi:dihydrofolate reductase